MRLHAYPLDHLQINMKLFSLIFNLEFELKASHRFYNYSYLEK